METIPTPVFVMEYQEIVGMIALHMGLVPIVQQKKEPVGAAN